MNIKAGERGFTLLELMIVIVILGVLGAVVAPRLMDEPDKARVTQAKLQIENFSTAIKKFYLDNGFYPTTDQGLEALVEKPASGRTPKNYPENGYIAKIPRDPWGNDYVYIAPGRGGPFEIVSYGADGSEGGEGFDADIYNADAPERR
ncbi:MAG: type II secretion system major pseudopilin GspG [Desulfovibrio sp.]|nr:type II secretion system major pseudopilin GspG [Desulfovibrio sp.]